MSEFEARQAGVIHARGLGERRCKHVHLFVKLAIKERRDDPGYYQPVAFDPETDGIVP